MGIAAPSTNTYYNDRVRFDVASGRQNGVTGTPTFLVNGLRQDGPDRSPTAICQILENKQGASLEQIWLFLRFA